MEPLNLGATLNAVSIRGQVHDIDLANNFDGELQFISTDSAPVGFATSTAGTDFVDFRELATETYVDTEIGSLHIPTSLSTLEELADTDFHESSTWQANTNWNDDQTTINYFPQFSNELLFVWGSSSDRPDNLVVGDLYGWDSAADADTPTITASIRQINANSIRMTLLTGASDFDDDPTASVWDNFYELDDPTLSDGDILTWDENSSKWVGAAPSVTANDATISIDVNGVNAGSFTTNQNTNETIDIPAVNLHVFVEGTSRELPTINIGDFIRWTDSNGDVHNFVRNTLGVQGGLYDVGVGSTRSDFGDRYFGQEEGAVDRPYENGFVRLADIGPPDFIDFDAVDSAGDPRYPSDRLFTLTPGSHFRNNNGLYFWTGGDVDAFFRDNADFTFEFGSPPDTDASNPGDFIKLVREFVGSGTPVAGVNPPESSDGDQYLNQLDGALWIYNDGAWASVSGGAIHASANFMTVEEDASTGDVIPPEVTVNVDGINTLVEWQFSSDGTNFSDLTLDGTFLDDDIDSSEGRSWTPRHGTNRPAVGEWFFSSYTPSNLYDSNGDPVRPPDATNSSVNDNTRNNFSAAGVNIGNTNLFATGSTQLDWDSADINSIMLYPLAGGSGNRDWVEGDQATEIFDELIDEVRYVLIYLDDNNWAVYQTDGTVEFPTSGTSVFAHIAGQFTIGLNGLVASNGSVGQASPQAMVMFNAGGAAFPDNTDTRFDYSEVSSPFTVSTNSLANDLTIDLNHSDTLESNSDLYIKGTDQDGNEVVQRIHKAAGPEIVQTDDTTIRFNTNEEFQKYLMVVLDLIN